MVSNEGTSPASSASTGLSNLVFHWLHVAQLLMALAVVYLFELENAAFLRVFELTTVGVIVNLVLPARARLPFFVLLSLTGVFVVFNPTDGAWLTAMGLLLVGLCHLPIPFRARVALMLGVVIGLAIMRSGQVASPWSSAVWPILGSMFMFRLVLYMMAVRTNQLGPQPVWGTIAYFFMLPNLVFPLFPVVDYQTFRRTHYDRADGAIYEIGLQWVVRGLAHLLLYRVVYHVFLNDPVDVVRLSDLVRFMLGTFLLYLKVSGQFHLIVGMLHLFGFRLPETHKLYYLAHSFTELWRRINIYWTDFMMKTVFYPVYFKTNQLGPLKALVVSTVAVFVVTWLLHAYQWFWLRNGFPITLQDSAFWGILGLLVTVGAVREFRAGKAPKRQASGWNHRLARQAVATFTAFCVLWSLWSTESLSRWVYMLGAAAEVDVLGVAMLGATLGIIYVLGGIDWNVAMKPRPGVAGFLMRPATRSVATLVVLLALAPRGLVAATPAPVSDALRALHISGLNQRDLALNHRGYYEQLDVRGQLTDVVFDIVGMRSADWLPFSTTGVLHERADSLLTRELNPSMSVVWNGHTLTTNRWGMRDQDYAHEKPPGTLRIAVLGPSFIMGSGVSDGEPFDARLEALFNADREAWHGLTVEVLNFGVEGHTFPEQVAMLEERALAFDPDIVIGTMYHPTRAWTERYVAKVARGKVVVDDPELRRLLETAGLGQSEGDVAVPFPLGRRIARAAGFNPRVPSAETAQQARRITDAVVDWSIRRFAATTRAHGVLPVIVGLNAVIDDEPDEIPHLRTFEDAKLPVLDLFGIYPEKERAAFKAAQYDEHPNARGHELIAARLRKELEPFVRARAEERAATLRSSREASLMSR